MAQRGMPKIEVTFDIDASGILHVTAKDVASGKDQSITISGSSGLSEDEVEKLRKEAEQFAEQDKKAKERVEVYNRLDSLAYQAEKQMKEFGDKLPADKKSALESKIAEVKKTLENKDVDLETLNTKETELMTALQEIGQVLYGNAGASAQPSGQPSASAEQPKEKKAEGNVVDADFEVVDDGAKK